MIIDNHTHLFTKRDAANYFKKSRAVFALTIVDPDWLDSKAKWCSLRELLVEEKRIGLIGSVPYESNLAPKQVEQLLQELENKSKGLKMYGIKLYPGYHQFYPSEKSLKVVYEYCIKKDVPVVFHSGDFDDPTGRARLKHSMPIHIDDVAVGFPNLKIVISHFGNPWFLETAAIVSHKQNVYTDISGFFWEHDPIKPALEFYTNKLKDVSRWTGSIAKKLLFGTDYSGENTPLTYVQPYIDVITRVFPREEDQRQIFSENARRVYRILL